MLVWGNYLGNLHFEVLMSEYVVDQEEVIKSGNLSVEDTELSTFHSTSNRGFKYTRIPQESLGTFKLM